MKSMKALLVQPRIPWPYRKFFGDQLMPPLALGYLAAVLIQQDVAVDILDLNMDELSIREFREFLAANCFDLVGISTTTETAKNSYKACRMVKETSPRTKTVIGGPHATFTPKEALQTGAVDFVVIGEGEETLVELAGFLRKGSPGLGSIKGLAFKMNGSIKINKARPPIEALDEVPIPNRRILKTERYPHPGVVLGSRGCPFQCVFCSAGAMAGGRFRVHGIERILEEIHLLVSEYGARQMLFTDNTTTVFPERMIELCRRIRKANLGISWFCESRADVITPELLESMAESGCQAIQFGLESGSQKILDHSKKHITLAQVEKAVKLAIKNGLLPILSYMIGHPNDTKRTIGQTIDFAGKMSDLGATPLPAIMTPFPGTRIFDRAEEFGIEILSDDWEDFTMFNPVMNTRFLKAEEIRSFYYDAFEQMNKSNMKRYEAIMRTQETANWNFY